MFDLSDFIKEWEFDSQKRILRPSRLPAQAYDACNN